MSGRVPRESRPSTSGNLQFQPVARPAMGRATLCFLGPGGNSQFSVLPKQASRAGPEGDEGQAPRATFSFNRTSNGQRGNPSFSFTTTPSFTKASYSSVKASKSLKGTVHNFFLFRSNLIFWIVMGCGIADFGRRGL